MDTDKRVARVFPRRTKATPDDDLVFVNCPPTIAMFMDPPTQVHVSCTFTADQRRAEDLAYQWEVLGVPVKVGGPAYGDRGGNFEPGMYLKHGYVITSRGCTKQCWFCDAWKREGPLRELPLTEGWNLLDNNILACSEAHIRKVFAMLAGQPKRPLFTGGLEPSYLRPWHVDLLRDVKAERLYFAYDTPDDLEPLVEAGRLLRAGGIATRGDVLKCYVLLGYRGDTFSAAEKRLKDAWRAGFMPYAMLYRDDRGQAPEGWKDFYRTWSRPQMVAAQLKGIEVMK